MNVYISGKLSVGKKQRSRPVPVALSPPPHHHGRTATNLLSEQTAVWTPKASFARIIACSILQAFVGVSVHCCTYIVPLIVFSSGEFCLYGHRSKWIHFPSEPRIFQTF